MAADAFDSSFFAADDALVGSLASTTDLTGTVHALVANLESELARRGAGADKAGVANGRSNGDRSVRVASRFLSEASAAFACNRPVLEALRERYRLGIVSNFYGNLEAVCHSAGLAALFAVVVDSHCVGAEKPDPAIFHVALETLRATPETTVFVGDSLRRDREGARRTGMRFIWIVPQGVPAAEAQAAAEQPVEHAVTELRDLMKILT
jgi:beta-phosphoglucomutase-like phosphatase (HAD superfamily)